MWGTRFGIGVDPADGLLKQGAEGYQLTWMDAKVGDWVVTPRRGKAVEINALWYNALRLLMSRCAATDGMRRPKILPDAERARQSFNERFWYEEGGYLYDVVDGENGDDCSCRPNQIVRVFPGSSGARQNDWKPVHRSRGRRKLVTPLGLRTLSRDTPITRATYDGDLPVARRRLPPRHRLGLAHRAFHRCVAEGASR